MEETKVTVGAGSRAKNKMPVNAGMDKKSRMSNPPFEVGNKFHSQGLASGGSALLDAVNKGKVHLAKFILDADDSHDAVNTRDFKGKTPLIRACYIKEERTRGRIVDLLINKCADVNIRDDSGRTALSYACELRCNNIVRKLVRHNGDPDIADDKGNTPLIYSSMFGNDTAVDILVRCFRRLGLQVDHTNNEGMTALLIAAKEGHVECAYTLALEGRASIQYHDPMRGLNAEDWAREQGCSTPEVIPFSEKGQAMLKAKRNPKAEPESDEVARLDYLRQIYYEECGGLVDEFDEEVVIPEDVVPQGEQIKQHPKTSSTPVPLDFTSNEYREMRRRSLPTGPLDSSSPEGTRHANKGLVDKAKQASLPQLVGRKNGRSRDNIFKKEASDEECLIEEDVVELEHWVNKGRSQLKKDIGKTDKSFYQTSYNNESTLPELDQAKSATPAKGGNHSPRGQLPPSRMTRKSSDSSSSVASVTTVTTVAVKLDTSNDNIKDMVDNQKKE